VPLGASQLGNISLIIPEDAMRETMNYGVIPFDDIARMYEEGILNIADVRAQYGHVIARHLLLAKYSIERDTGWPRVDYPPKMFISHKWREDNTACAEATELAESLSETGVDVVFDQWWSDEQNRDLEWRISLLAASRTVFFLLTPDYFDHTSLDTNAGRFRASWVEEEMYFTHNLYTKQLEESPEIGAVIDPTGLLLDSDHEPKQWFNRLFDVSLPEKWQAFLASFAGLRVHTLSQADQQMIWKHARTYANIFLAGRHSEAFSALARLAADFPFVGDLAIMLVKMAQETGDIARACDAARIGAQSTEDWRWEHRWLKAQWKLLR
jgi:hypothetical protein